jgi:hypothetical protein
MTGEFDHGKRGSKRSRREIMAGAVYSTKNNKNIASYNRITHNSLREMGVLHQNQKRELHGFTIIIIETRPCWDDHDRST